MTGYSSLIGLGKSCAQHSKEILRICRCERNGDLWPIGRYNIQHETDHRGDAHIPGSPWLIRFISPETVAGRGVEKRRIRHGVRHSRTDAKVFRGDRLDLLAWRSGP